MVDSRGLDGLSCRKSGPRHIRHSQLNDLIWRAVTELKYQSPKSQLVSYDPMERGSTEHLSFPGNVESPCMGVWTTSLPIHVPHLTLAKQLRMQDPQRTRQQQTKSQKYNSFVTTHHFISIAIETTGPWNSEASEFIAELGKKIAEVTLEPLE